VQVSDYDDLIKRTKLYYHHLPVGGMTVLDELVNALADAKKALTQIEQISDHLVDAERYTALDAFNDLQSIRNIIRKFLFSGEEGKSDE
jgi:hypothetical protein